MLFFLLVGFWLPWFRCWHILSKDCSLINVIVICSITKKRKMLTHSPFNSLVMAFPARLDCRNDVFFHLWNHAFFLVFNLKLKMWLWSICSDELLGSFSYPSSETSYIQVAGFRTYSKFETWRFCFQAHTACNFDFLPSDGIWIRFWQKLSGFLAIMCSLK